MDVASLFDSLLAIGRSGRFEGIHSLPGVGVHDTISRFADTHRKALIGYFIALDESDKGFFVKAVAAYENTVGGLGSVTTLHSLLPLMEDPNHSIIDWILSNTRSYWWYAHGATSFAELQLILQYNEDRRVESFRREDERAAAARLARAERATGNLYRAAFRGDVKAVVGLLANGADPSIKSPDGASLYEFAIKMQRADIAAILAASIQHKNAP
jgi:hypothetical protein